MIPPSAQSQLDMLRRAPRPSAAAGPTKRPHGGRPNPCALHRTAASRPIVVRHAPPKRRRLSEVAPWKLLVAAVLSGRLPVGVHLRLGDITRIIGPFGGGAEMLSLRLAQNETPVRLRHIGPGHASYRIDLV